MCDYSLAFMDNRLATVGEELVVHRFCTGSLGLASPADVERLCAPKPRVRFEWPWAHWTRSRLTLPELPCAVCMPPGARLFLQNIPERLQQQFGVGTAEEVTFVQVSAEAYRYRDAVRFRNGQEVLLQRLSEGQRVHVLSLDAAESIEPRKLLAYKRGVLGIRRELA